MVYTLTVSLHLIAQMPPRRTAVILLEAMETSFSQAPEQCDDVSCIGAEPGCLCVECEASSEGRFPTQPAKPLLGMSIHTQGLRNCHCLGLEPSSKLEPGEGGTGHTPLSKAPSLYHLTALANIYLRHLWQGTNCKTGR